jgi:hypothetical protein
MNEIIFTVKDSPEGGYEAEALGYSIFTEADDMKTMKEAIRDAVFCHFENKEDRPRIIRLHYVKEEILAA